MHKAHTRGSVLAERSHESAFYETAAHVATQMTSPMEREPRPKGIAPTCRVICVKIERSSICAVEVSSTAVAIHGPEPRRVALVDKPCGVLSLSNMTSGPT